MASYAHAAHPNQQQYLMVRADIAAQGFEHIAFTIEQLTRLVKRVAASVKPALQRWAAAHQQAVQDRLFWELALTDRRLMAEIRAIQHHAEQGQ
jgi:hypothetical protein